jgi:L-ascorbate metabolism protein UlaG (beta-lactamase superfamily)
MKSLGSRAAGARLERMRASAQWFDAGDRGGAGFRNRGPFRPGLLDPQAARVTLSEFLCGGNRRVPTGSLPVIDPRESWLRAPGKRLRATWLGHSTVLLEMQGERSAAGSVKRLLTDPVFGPRASPSRLAGPKRFHPVPVPLKALPPLDAVLITHDHYDHLCMATVRELARLQPTLPFITSLGVGAHLEAFGVPAERITELDWWQEHEVPRTGIRFTAVPAQHFSGRGLKDRNATLWASYVIESERERVFFSGDTGLTDQYALIREHFAGGKKAAKDATPFDLVMLEVGAFHPSWGDIHLGPENALEALELLGGGALLPVHWGTFSLAMHAWDEPAETLLRLAPEHGVHLVMPRLGEPVVPAEADGLRPWWRGIDTREEAPAQEVLSWPKALPFPLD